jgi:hypothetical protein
MARRLELSRWHAVFKWLVRPWRWWGVVVFLCFLVVYIMNRSNLEQNIKILGFLFQVYGFFLAMVDQHFMSSKYMIPGMWLGARKWWSSCPLRKCESVFVDVPAIAAKWRAIPPTIVITKNDATLEERIGYAEGAVKELRKLIKDVRRELIGKVDDCDGKYSKAMSNLDGRLNIISSNILEDRKGVVDGGRIGVFVFLFGTLLTTFPEKLASFFG